MALNSERLPIGKCRAMVFTWFGKTANEAADIMVGLGCRYCVAGNEICPETEREHVQGYVYWNNARSFAEVHKECEGIWLKRARGSAEQNKAYCSKEGDWLEVGDMPQQGRRCDLEEIARQYLELGEAMFADEYPGAFMKYYKGLRELEKVKYRGRERVKVSWMGVEQMYMKMHLNMVKREFGGEVYVKRGKSEFWNDYNGEDVVVLWDFDEDSIDFMELELLLTERKYSVNMKFGSAWLRAAEVIIICERTIEDCKYKRWQKRRLEELCGR